jgi:hypothetical protein
VYIHRDNENNSVKGMSVWAGKVRGRKSEKSRGFVLCVKSLINGEVYMKVEHIEDEAC